MKKMWKLNNKAVSPVIATILMVAITVVLAAVLYVMVMGFGQDTTAAPSADFTTNGNRLVISLSEAQDIEEGMSLSFIVNGTAVAIEDLTFASGSATITGQTDYVFVDAGLDGKVNTGDYFTNAGDDAGEIKLVWTSGGTNQILAEQSI